MTTTSTLQRGWYVVHCQSGWEDRVKNTLETKVAMENLSDRIYSVLIPTEDVVEVKKNKKKISKRKFFPGYVLVDMKVDEITYWLVKGIPGVSHFLGEPNPKIGRAHV
jgi:transcriptional antiterminator NusG